MELILKRVRFQIGEPRTAGDMSVNLCSLHFKFTCENGGGAS